MAENVEEIEAKLAAYVDGELTPAERVEIETYLQSNPSHRALLQDLVLHRNLLRGLPREKAPGDCTEGFQGQLERDILLGGDELSRSRSRFRIHYSPQLLSAAAIFLVAVALGIIVYTVLPPHQPHAPIAQLSTEPSKTAEPALTESLSDTLADVRSYKAAPVERMSKKGATDDSLALNNEALGQKLDNSRYAAFKTQAEQQPIAAGDMMVITVTADDVKSANEAVVSYLALNKINYTAEAEGFWKDGVDALAAGRRLAGGMVAPGGAGGAGQGGAATGAGLDTLTAAQLPALRSNVDEVATREEAERGRLDAPRPDRKAESKAASGKQDEKQLAEQVLADKDQPQREERLSKLAARPAAIQPQATASPTTQPSAVALSGIDRRGINDTVNAKTGGGGSASDAGAVLLRQQQVRVPQSDPENAGARVILARNMNDQQVQDLAACLSQPERNLYATVHLDRSDAYRSTGLATLARLDDKDQKERSLAYQRPVQENEVMLRQKVVAANAPAPVAPTTRPAESFALNIKPAEAGLTRGASDDAIRVNGTIAPNSDPSDFNFAEVNQQVQVPAQQQALFGAIPTTQPVLGRGTRDLYTCVIVVQNTTSARASGPATQPVAGKPTTAPAATPPTANEAK